MYSDNSSFLFVFIFLSLYFFFFPLYRGASTWAAKYVKEIRKNIKGDNQLSYICTQKDDAVKAVRQSCNSYNKILHLKKLMLLIQFNVMNTTDNIGIPYLQYKQCLTDFLRFFKKISNSQNSLGRKEPSKLIQFNPLQ